MASNMVTSALKKAYRSFILQAMIGLLIGCALVLVQSQQVAYSFLLGNAVSLLPAIVFASKTLVQLEIQQAQDVVNSFYVGELVKLLTMITLFMIVFLFITIKPAAFFLGFIVAQLLPLVIPALNLKRSIKLL